MKKLMYAIASSLAFLSVTSASQAIANPSTELLTPENYAATWQTNQTSQPIQLADDSVTPSVAQAATPVSIAAKTACKGDAARATPPIPNYPTHIRNVVWRNTRALCLQQIAQRNGNPQLTNQR